MKKIEYFKIYYNPNGSGSIVLKLEGINNDITLPHLTALDTATIATMLLHGNIFYDNQRQEFSASN